MRTAPTPGAWSANDVLAQRRACAAVWGDCIVAILAEETPTLRAVDPRTWLAMTDDREQDFPPALHAFTTQRSVLLEALAPPTPADWERTATVTGAGRPLVRSVRTYAQWLASHERAHLTPIAQTANTPSRHSATQKT